MGRPNTRLFMTFPVLGFDSRASPTEGSFESVPEDGRIWGKGFVAVKWRVDRFLRRRLRSCSSPSRGAFPLW